MTAAEQGAAVDGPNVADVLAALDVAVASGHWGDWQTALRMFRQSGGAQHVIATVREDAALQALLNPEDHMREHIDAEVSRQVAAREAEAWDKGACDCGDWDGHPGDCAMWSRPNPYLARRPAPEAGA